MGNNPLYEDLPYGTIITDELRLERMQDPKYFPKRKFFCIFCREQMEYCGSRPIFDNSFSMVQVTTQYLFYCKLCNVNFEATKLGRE